MLNGHKSLIMPQLHCLLTFHQEAGICKKILNTSINIKMSHFNEQITKWLNGRTSLENYFYVSYWLALFKLVIFHHQLTGVVLVWLIELTAHFLVAPTLLRNKCYNFGQALYIYQFFNIIYRGVARIFP